MIDEAAIAVFGHRNARSKTPAQVAEGFVAPRQYWEIIQPGNTVLTGPRGSGKTTILKMLEGSGLEAWQDPRADEARAIASYSGVFIPADRSWAGQVSSYSGVLEDRLRAALGQACFTLHVLRALSQCAAERIRPAVGRVRHDRVELRSGDQAKIASDVWRSWALSEPVGSFAGLAEALGTLISEIGSLARRALRLPEAADQLWSHSALDLAVADAIVPFIDRFNRAAGQEGHVWAFLIDEIEFLPPGIDLTIMELMRGHDPRITQKVSLAPYTLTGSRLAGTPLAGWEGHDFEPVDLTFSEKEDGYGFSRELVEKEIEGLEGELTVEGLLGDEPGFFEMKPGSDAYLPGSKNADAIVALADKDAAFADWLTDHKIDAKRPDSVKGDRRASTLRKAIPVILLRDEFLFSPRGRLVRRSRKAERTYVGELSAYAICENNPRRLQTLVSRLYGARKLDDGTRAEVTGRLAHEFELHLRAIEVPETTPTALLPRQMIQAIGDHFADLIYDRQNFDPEPPLSFEVPKAAPRDVLRRILWQLASYGAIVPIEIEDENKERYRLAHTFAPTYRLPLRKGRARALHSIISSDRGASDQLPMDDGADAGIGT